MGREEAKGAQQKRAGWLQELGVRCGPEKGWWQKFPAFWEGRKTGISARIASCLGLDALVMSLPEIQTLVTAWCLSCRHRPLLRTKARRRVSLNRWHRMQQDENAQEERSSAYVALETNDTPASGLPSSPKQSRIDQDDQLEDDLDIPQLPPGDVSSQLPRRGRARSSTLGGFAYAGNLLALAASSEEQPAQQTKRHKLNAFNGAALMLGVQIGAGIFSSPGVVLSETKAPGPALLVWLGGGLLAWLGAASFAELGAASASLSLSNVCTTTRLISFVSLSLSL